MFNKGMNKPLKYFEKHTEQQDGVTKQLVQFEDSTTRALLQILGILIRHIQKRILFFKYPAFQNKKKNYFSKTMPSQMHASSAV